MNHSLKIIAIGSGASSFVLRFFNECSNSNIFTFPKSDATSISLFKKIVKELDNQYDNLVLVITFLSGRATKRFIEKIQNYNFKSAICLYSKPFRWEGIKRQRISQYSENLLISIFPSHISIDLNLFPHLKLSGNYFENADNLFYSFINELLNTLTKGC